MPTADDGGPLAGIFEDLYQGTLEYLGRYNDEALKLLGGFFTGSTPRVAVLVGLSWRWGPGRDAVAVLAWSACYAVLALWWRGLRRAAAGCGGSELVVLVSAVTVAAR
ncbi:MAG: hypothetical protein ACR2GH_04250 [Pseudonocardia sp.]